MTLSSPKGFEIGQPTRDIRRVWKLPLGLNNPVDLGLVDFDLRVPPSGPAAQPLLPNSH